MSFYETFLYLCNSVEMPPSRIAIENKISKAAVCRWKNGSMPSDATIKKLADYFGVSVEYLKGETNVKNPSKTAVTDDDIKFALWGDVADEIPNDKLEEVKNFAEFIKSTYKKDKK